MSADMTLLERLNEQIGELEYAKMKLEEKIDDQKHLADWHWRQIRQLTEEENLGLPIPRLEIRYRKDAYNSYADYGLVTRHLMKHIDFTPMSSTRVSKDYADKLELPYRDGAHIVHDKENLNLPAYIVFEGKSKEIPFKHPEERTSNF